MAPNYGHLGVIRFDQDRKALIWRQRSWLDEFAESYDRGVMRMRILSAKAGLITVALALSFAGPVAAGELEEPKYPNIVAPELQFGGYGTEDDQLIAPRGVELSDDEIFVADCVQNRVSVIDFNGDAVRTGAWPSLSCPKGLSLDERGHLFVANAGNHSVDVVDSESFEILRSYTFSAPARPTDVTTWGDHVVVTTSGDMQVHVLDEATGQDLFSFGGLGTAEGQFKLPASVVSDQQGRIYVADKYNHRIQVFGSDGEFLFSFGEFGSYPGQLAGPAGIDTAGNTLFVTDSVNHRVQAFSLHGNLEFHFGRHPTEPHQGNGHTHYPLPLATDGDNRVAFCEKNEARCQVFAIDKVREETIDVSDSAWWNKYPYFHYRSKISSIELTIVDGYVQSSSQEEPPSWPENPPRVNVPLSTTSGSVEFVLMSEEDLHRIAVMEQTDEGPQSVLSFGNYGSRPGEFAMPQGVAMDPWGRLWVADSLNGRIQVFDINGYPLKTFDESVDPRLAFSEPGGVTVDEDGYVYIPDAGNDRIVVLDKEGEFVDEWGRTGRGDGELSHPVHVALSPDGETVYVVELYNSRVQKFDTQGTFLGSFGRYGTGDGEFVRPMNVTTNTTGQVIVTDDALDRVQLFESDGTHIRTFGSHGSGDGEMVNPQGVAATQDGTILVLDYGNHRGQAFDQHGSFLYSFGEGQIGNPEADDASWIPENLILRLAVPALVLLPSTGALWFGLRLYRRRTQADA